MFLSRWIRKAPALPLLWAGQVLSWAKLPLSVSFLKAAWIISGDGDWGRLGLLAAYRVWGIEGARPCAGEWMNRRPSPELAAVAGLWALEAGDLDAAEELLRRGRELGDDRHGLLDTLELLTTSRRGRAEEAEVVSRFVTRRDLPPMVSKMVQTSVCWTALLAGDVGQAEWQARRLLEVEPNGVAEIVLATGAKARGDDARAAAHLAAANDVSAPKRLYLEAMGDAVIGRADETRQAIASLRQDHPELALDLERFLTSREGAA